MLKKGLWSKIFPYSDQIPVMYGCKVGKLKQNREMGMSSSLGCNIWWTLPETSVDGIRAQTLLAKHGFEPGDMKLPTRQLEVSRAIKSFHNRRTKHNRKIGEKVKETMDAVIYGILEREQDGDEVGFEQRTTIKLDKATGEVSVSGNLSDAFREALNDATGKITDEDIRYFLRKVIRMCYGIAKRPTGGIYFVPEKFAGILDQAKALVAEFDSSSRIYVERVMDGIEERQNVWGSVEAEVEDRVASAVAAVGRIERLSSIKGKNEDIEEARELMQVYQQLLGEEAKYEALAEKIETAVRIVGDKLSSQSGIPSVPTSGVTSGAEKIEKASGGKTVVEAALVVLAKVGKPLSSRDIMDQAVKDGLYETTCAAPYESFISGLTKAINKGEKRIVRCGRGIYQAA